MITDLWVWLVEWASIAVAFGPAAATEAINNGWGG